MDSLDQPGKQLASQYFPVSRAKFALLSFLTFGIYSIYWFYKNWRYVRDRDDSNIWPFWRAIFSPILCYLLIRDLRANHAQKSDSLVAYGGVLAIVYFALLATSRLPDPYWLGSMVAFVLLLPIVSTINKLNGPTATYDRNSRMRLRHFALMLVAGPLVVLAVAPTLNLVPHVAVVEGSRVPPWHVEWMLEQGMLIEDETVVYFYGGGLLSFRIDGNIITDQAVVTYWQEEAETYFDYANYEEITSVDVSYGSSLFEDTTIRVIRSDGAELLLWASTDEGRDHEFVAALEARIGHEDSS